MSDRNQASFEARSNERTIERTLARTLLCVVIGLGTLTACMHKEAPSGVGTARASNAATTAQATNTVPAANTNTEADSGHVGEIRRAHSAIPDGPATEQPPTF